jgi:hypothetical protein
LWWRKHESGADTSRSLILKSRTVNDASPAHTIALAERNFGPIDGKRVALMGAAYRFDSEDTRNSPTLSLASQLLARGCQVTLHDPYVKPDDQNLRKFSLTDYFTNDIRVAVNQAEVLIFCVGHGVYGHTIQDILAVAPKVNALLDGANLFKSSQFGDSVNYAGIGRGKRAPDQALVDFTIASFRAMEQGVANELDELITFLNAHYAADGFNQVSLDSVRSLAGSCVTGCAIGYPATAAPAPQLQEFSLELTRTAVA